MKPESSLPHLQVPATYPYPEPDRPVLAPTSHLKVHLYIILPSTPRSSEWSVSLWFPTKALQTSPLPHSCYMTQRKIADISVSL